jgi:hypothetical protein
MGRRSEDLQREPFVQTEEGRRLKIAGESTAERENRDSREVFIGTRVALVSVRDLGLNEMKDTQSDELRILESGLIISVLTSLVPRY